VGVGGWVVGCGGWGVAPHPPPPNPQSPIPNPQYINSFLKITQVKKLNLIKLL